MLSDDGQWQLQTLTTGITTRLRLTLRRTNNAGDGQSFDRIRLEPDQQWAVLDGSGATLLMGWLDEDGELEEVWGRPMDLRSHLAQFGGGWKVEPV